MVFGHNLRYMAPFDFSRVGFCMVFQCASFVFSCPRADFGAQVRIGSSPGQHFGLGTFLRQFWRPIKRTFVMNCLCVEDSEESG